MPKRDESSGSSSSDATTTLQNSNEQSSANKKARPMSAFTVIVGGTSFRTSRQTLIDGSEYFAALLGSNFNDNELTVEGYELYVDRDPEPFAVLLSNWRSGVFLCSSPDLLAKVLVEAEFFLLDTLLASIKRDCIRNLFSTKGFSSLHQSDEEADAKANERFPSLTSLLKSPYFPHMYYAPVHYSRILSTEPMANERTYVHFTSIGGASYEYLTTAWITYERTDNKAVVREPLVTLKDRRISPWTLLDFSSDPKFWKDVDGPSTSLLPFSFCHQASLSPESRNPSWSLRVKTMIEAPKEGEVSYYAKQEGKPMRHIPTNIEITRDLESNKVVDTKCFSYSAGGKLVDVTTFSNFISFEKPDDA